MDLLRLLAALYCVLFLLVTSLGHIPGLADAQGLTFGLFRLTFINNDLLHGGSALWAGLAAWWSHRASLIFFRAFGTLYCLDGLLGVVTGSGYLDLGICINGVLDLPLTTKVLTSLPHIAIGGFAVLVGFAVAPRLMPRPA